MCQSMTDLPLTVEERLHRARTSAALIAQLRSGHRVRPVGHAGSRVRSGGSTRARRVQRSGRRAAAVARRAAECRLCHARPSAGVTSGRGTLREIRFTLALSQTAFACRLDVSVGTLRTWDSGRRPTPDAMLDRAVQFVPRSEAEVRPLRELAIMYGFHVRTLRAAAKDGRLQATFANRAFFGRAVALATCQSVEQFLTTGYGSSAKGLRVTPALSDVPPDYATRILAMRLRLGLTQDALARRISAASRAVVYQWEVGKRKPSPVFWSRLTALAECAQPHVSASRRMAEHNG
jgi:DNA-binding transcriptional regulator YiaG